MAVGANPGANQTCVSAGPNGFRDTIPDGDDAVSGNNITTGANGICNTTANAQNLAPTNTPAAAALQTYLKKVWTQQANVHFTVTRSDHTVNFDLNRGGTLAHPASGSAPDPAEGNAISTAAKK